MIDGNTLRKNGTGLTFNEDHAVGMFIHWLFDYVEDPFELSRDHLKAQYQAWLRGDKDWPYAMRMIPKKRTHTGRKVVRR